MAGTGKGCKGSGNGLLGHPRRSDRPGQDQDQDPVPLVPLPVPSAPGHHQEGTLPLAHGLPRLLNQLAGHSDSHMMRTAIGAADMNSKDSKGSADFDIAFHTDGPEGEGGSRPEHPRFRSDPTELSSAVQDWQYDPRGTATLANPGFAAEDDRALYIHWLHSKWVATGPRVLYTVNMSPSCLTATPCDPKDMNCMYLAIQLEGLTSLVGETIMMSGKSHITLSYVAAFDTWYQFWRFKTHAAMLMTTRLVSLRFEQRGKSSFWLVDPNCEMYTLLKMLADVLEMCSSEFQLPCEYHVTWHKLRSVLGQGGARTLAACMLEPGRCERTVRGPNPHTLPQHTVHSLLRARDCPGHRKSAAPACMQFAWRREAAGEWRQPQLKQHGKSTSSNMLHAGVGRVRSKNRNGNSEFEVTHPHQHRILNTAQEEHY
jgi:hypothetical protein